MWDSAGGFLGGYAGVSQMMGGRRWRRLSNLEDAFDLGVIFFR